MKSSSYSAAAPGWPGIAPTWTSSAKDVVMTALGPSRIWATVGHGIVNEVYWPSAGRPQIRDLGFIIASPSSWHEVKRVARYQLSLPKPYVPLPRIVHQGDDYQLELELSPIRSETSSLSRSGSPAAKPSCIHCLLHISTAPA